jgi:carboxyl-terminal processing protease
MLMNQQKNPNRIKYFLLSLTILISSAVFAKSEDAYNKRSEEIRNAEVDIKDLPNLSPEDTFSKASHLVTQLVAFYHYRNDFNFDNKFSAQAFDAYLEQLDANHIYFTKQDIKAFSKYRLKIDDAVYDGNVKPAFEIFETFRKRWIERYKYALQLLQSDFNFKLDENYLYDRSEAEFVDNDKDLNELWRKRVKNDYLSQLLTDKTPDEIKEKLATRYKASMRRMVQTESSDVFRYFMTAVTQTVEPHTSYFSPRAAEDFNTEMSLSLEGIGAMLQTDDVETKIVKLITGGPAKRSGQIKKDDVVVAVGQGKKGALQEVIGWRLDNVVDLIKGKAGSTVRLEILTPDSASNVDTRVVTIVREKIKLEDQEAKAKVIDVTRNGKTYHMGVIDLPKFYINFKEYYEGKPDYKSTTRDVKKLIEDLKKKGVDGIIMDLRNNGGGSLMEATQLTGLFIDKGPVVQERDSKNRIKVHPDLDSGVSYSGPVAVLVNRFSASASEIFAGAIQDYGRGIVIGNTTFGKGTIQTVRDLDQWNTLLPGKHLGQLKFTSARFYRISGDSTQIRGVIPDVTLPKLIDTEEYGEGSLENALPWDHISAAHYVRQSLDDLVPQLQQNSAKRIKNDAQMKLLESEYQAFQDLRQEKFVSLNLEQRKKKRIENKQKSLKFINARRRFLGQPEFASIKQAEDEEDNTEEEENKFDPVLTEAGKIITDFMELKLENKKIAVNQ